MAKKQTRKPAKRKTGRATAVGGSLSKLKGTGWVVACAVAGSWAVSAAPPDLRAALSRHVSDVGGFFGSEGKKGVGDVIAEYERAGPSRTREEAVTTGSIPMPRRRAQEASVPGSTQVAILQPLPLVPLPRTAPSVPSIRPIAENRPPLVSAPFVMAPILPTASVGSVSATLGKRHATRALAAHSAPDGASPKVAEIESGTSVTVIRTAGDWRLVRDARTSSEGWVDGRYLAGEAMAADLVSFGRSR